jgi:hypothetical protein
MKLKTTFNKIIHNKYILYIVFLFSIITFFAQLISGNIDMIIIFFCLAIITYYFTSNMIIVLIIPVIVVNLFNYLLPSKLHSGKEGMENKNPDQEKIDVVLKKPKTASNSQVVLPSDENINTNSTDDLSTSNEEFKNHDSKESNKDKKKKYHIDYASTVEEAYDNLNSVVGSEGIQNLTKDTKKLMKQQMQLAEAMKSMKPLMESMTPLLNQAGSLLNTMGGNENISNLAKMAQSLMKTEPQ